MSYVVHLSEYSVKLGPALEAKTSPHQHARSNTQGTNIFCYKGHTSPVTSLCYSPSGRYLVSCSDIGERAIRVWLAGMPLYEKDPVSLGLRLRWTRSGLIKRVRANTEPSAMGFFLSRQEDRESRESSDESAGEKVGVPVAYGQSSLAISLFYVDPCRRLNGFIDIFWRLRLFQTYRDCLGGWEGTRATCSSCVITRRVTFS